MRDKIVAGIVIVAILGIFFTGVSNKDSGGHRFISKQGQPKEGGQEEEGGEGQEAAEKGQSPGQGEGQGQGQGQSQGQGQVANASQAGGQAQQQGAAGQPAAAPPKLAPSLAVDFVRWWLTMALDYSVNTGAANHKKAMSYAKPQVARTFSDGFYTQDVIARVANGTLAGSFQPATVQAVAINPDGSVVVTVIGTLSMQSSGSQPVSQSLVLEFLVSKDNEGCRMTGFFNKTISQAPAAPAAESDERPVYPGQ